MSDGITLSYKEANDYEALREFIEKSKDYIIIGISLQRRILGLKDRS